MNFIKQYWQYILIGVLLIIIIVGSYFLGISWKGNKLIKYKEQEALEKIKSQDSIFKEAGKRVLILQDSLNVVLNRAVVKTKEGEKIKIIIQNDKQSMNEEISNINNLSVKDGVDSFNAFADRYNP